MKKLFISVFMAAVANLAVAAGSSFPLLDFEPDMKDKAGLQSGAATFVNYCYGCHSMKYMRFNRMATDLGMPEDLVVENFIFDGSKVGALMQSPVDTRTAKKWFGAAPPDLTLVARARGPEWLYTYLKSFHVDESRPYGYNNLLFKDVGMPNVLAGVQGDQVCAPAYSGKIDPLTGEKFEVEGSVCGRAAHVKGTGTASPEEFDKLVTDLVSFLVYAGEPAKLHDRTFLGMDLNKSEVIGVYCLLFLSVFMVFALLLNREYWKDIH